jgi:hypothetical protein
MKQRALDVSLAMSLLLCCLSSTTVTSQAPQSATGSSDTVPGPSMKETEAWIRREFPKMGAVSVVEVRQDDQSRERILRYETESAALSECRFSIRWIVDVGMDTERQKPVGPGPSANRQTHAETAAMTDVDVSSLRPVEFTVARAYRRSVPLYMVSLKAAADRGEPFTSQITLENRPPAEAKTVRSLNIFLRDLEAANQAADVLRRAALLCGAPSQSIRTGVTSVLGKDVAAAGNTPPAGSRMTNGEVIQLVAAGLSEQVVITSIRQTLTKSFDLTPTGLIALKQGNVPDAVILAMQAASGSSGTVNTAATAAEGAQAAAQAAGAPAKAFEFYYRGGKFGDYIILNANGTFELGAGAGSHDRGTYTVDGSAITFAPSSKPGGKYRLLSNPAGSNRIEAGKIVEPDGSFWAPLAGEATTMSRPVAATPPIPSNGCSGIENMGLYKNEIFDRAMGGGVVEWLAKVRNNTPVTKIVVLGWRDMYGQQKSTQVQVQGGGIASPRLDLTQARAIPPVADVRLLSCQ